jgi:capsular exopolysaccharide synthesis family protein
VAASSIPDILLVRVHGAPVEEVVVLAQAIAEVYRNTAANQRQASLGHLKEMRSRTEESLQRKRQRLAQLESSRLVAAEREASQARFELRVARAEQDLQEKRRPGTDRVQVSDQALSAALKDDTLGQKVLGEMVAAEEDIKKVFRVSVLKEHDPILPDLYRRRDEARKKLAARREELRPILEQHLRERALEQYQAQLNRSRERVAFCEGLVKSLDDEVERLGGAAATEELKMLREEAAAAGESLRKHAQDQHLLENTSLPASAEQSSELVALQRKDAKGRLRSAALGGVGCCAFLMLAVSWRELRLRRITSGSDIASGLGLPVLGNIPVKRRGRTLTREQLDGQGNLREAVDALRTVLLHDHEKGPRLLLVTSAIHGEGKTTLAALLAASLARAWRKTLLIDADLRTPAAHQLFQTQLEPGLSEILRGEAEPADVVQPTELSRLWMITAGHWDSHAIQALAQDGVGRLFDSLKEQFDFLVIDACPILPVADALLLSTHVDAVLLAMRSGISRLPVVQAAQQRLTALDAPLRGAILMGPDLDVGSRAVPYPAGEK